MTKFHYFLMIIVFGIISFGSLMDIAVTHKIRAYLTFLPSNDMLHLILFAGLAYILCTVCRDIPKYTFKQIYLTIAITLLFFGICIELLQSTFTTTREAELIDIFANFAGTLIGMMTFILRTRIKKRCYKAEKQRTIKVDK